MDSFTRRFNASVRRKELRERIIDYKGGGCRICGYNRSLLALELHHLNSLEKEFSISSKLTSWMAIAREIEKCVLLCSNCHREVHDGMHPTYLEDPSMMRGQLD